jgi:DNA-binding PadR family transcriptional regulator
MPKKAMDILTESMFYVLMAFCHGPMCGIDAAQFIEERTHGRLRMGPATLYTVIGKFEKEKYIKEVEVEGRKRTYQITDKGRRAYDEELNRLRQCVADAEGGCRYVR